MKAASFRAWPIIFAAGGWLMACSGCMPVERLSVFDVDVEKAVVEESAGPTLPSPPLQIGEQLTEEKKHDAELPEDLSVEQAVMLALHNNSDLQVRQLNPVIAGTFEQIERGIYDPELFAEASYYREEGGDIGDILINRREDSSEETLLIGGVRQYLPTGTDIEARIGHDRSIFSDTAEEQEARLQLSVTQSLLQGFGTAVNLASIRQAELETMASIDELKGFINSMLADTEIAYWQYVLALDEIAIFEQSLEVARKQREEIELSIEVGFLPEFEAAAARAEEAFRVQALINATSLLQDRRLRLLRLITPHLGSYMDRAFNVVSEPRILPLPIDDVEDRVQLAERIRPDLNEARLRLRQNRLETILTRNGLLPRLELFMVLGKTGYGDSFGDSLADLDGEGYDISAGVRLNHLLGNRAAEARNLAAFATRKQAEESIANLRQIIRLDVHLAVNEVERLRQQIDASKATRLFQEQTLNAEEERFEVGSSTALLVAQAQRDLLRAQIAEVEAIVNYRIALVQLYLAEGSLMERRGVSIAGGGTTLFR